MGESNCLATYPLSCLFSRTSKYGEREDMDFSSVEKTAVDCNNRKNLMYTPWLSKVDASSKDYNEILKYSFYYMTKEISLL